MCTQLGGGRYSDSRYSDISKWAMQWVTVRTRIRIRIRVRARARARDRARVTITVTVTVRVRVSVSCAFSEAFVGIAALGIAACTYTQ